MKLPKGYDLNGVQMGTNKELVELVRSPYSIDKITKLATLRAKYVTEPYCYIQNRSKKDGRLLKNFVKKWFVKEWYIINGEKYFYESTRLNGKRHARDITMVEPSPITREDIELAKYVDNLSN